MKKSDIFLIILIVILVVTYIFIRTFTNNSKNILSNYAKRNSTNIISNIINNSIYDILYNNDYDDLIIYNNSDINSLDFNNSKINSLLYLITNNILNSISDLESNNRMIYYVPVGIIYSIPILVNIGPKIPFKIDVVGDINNEININTLEYGINNVIVEVLLNIKLNVQVILPFVSETLFIEKNLILDSKLIQGNIPNYYGNYDRIY